MVKISFWGEYGCEKGGWYSSVPLEVEFNMRYQGQNTYTIKIPVIDCVEENHYNSICIDCPTNGEVICGSITMWTNNPFGKNIDVVE